MRMFDDGAEKSESLCPKAPCSACLAEKILRSCHSGCAPEPTCTWEVLADKSNFDCHFANMQTHVHISRCLLHMPQVGMALCTAESAARA